MIKTLYFFILTGLILIFIGCETVRLTSTSQSTFISDNIEYSVYPLTEELARKYDIDPMFANLNLHTPFLIKITNYSANIIQTCLKDTFAFRDSLNIEHHLIEDPVMYLKDYLENSEFSDLTFTELKEMEIELENLLNSDILTENIDYIQSQLIDLKQKIYYLERKNIFENEMKRKEKMFRDMLKIYSYKDQIIYPQGSNVGVLLFPQLSGVKLDNSRLCFLIPNNQIISVSFTVTPEN